MKNQKRMIWLCIAAIMTVTFEVFAEPADHVFTGGKVYTVNEAPVPGPLPLAPSI